MSLLKKYRRLINAGLVSALLTTARAAESNDQAGNLKPLVTAYERLRGVQDAKNCLMGKPGREKGIDCLTTGAKLMPDDLYITGMQQRIACVRALGATLTAVETAPGAGRAGAIAGGIIGSGATPAGTVIGAGTGWALGTVAAVAPAALAIADCALETWKIATWDPEAAMNKEREATAAAEAAAKNAVERARNMESQCNINCHTAVGGGGPVTFESIRSSVNSYVSGAQAYADVSRGREPGARGYSHRGGLSESGDRPSRSGGTRGGSGGNEGGGGGRGGGASGGHGGGGSRDCRDFGGGTRGCFGPT